MATFTGWSHVALTVRDLGTSERWYADVLGFRRLFHEPGHDHEFVVLVHPATELVVGLHAHAANDGQPCRETNTGLDHVALRVEGRAELEAWLDVLTTKGVLHSPIVDAPYGHVLSFRDPDGIPFELFAMPGT